MRLLLIRLLVACAGLLGLGPGVQAATTLDTPYTDRGQTDFDTALVLLNPYGKWSKIGAEWAYTPLDHMTPYTNGRWIYTEYGWYWKGRAPHSWATEHYGYWKCGAGKVWSWYPGPYWLPQIVEIRATDHYIGWRSGEVDEEGNFVEAPIDRFSRTEEWTFVTLEQFANPITPAVVAPVNVARAQLEDSTECRHTYLTYRIIDRPGPHPADFADLCHDGGMLAPAMTQDQAVAPATQAAAPNSYAAKMTGTNAPALLGQGPQEINPAADTRKVNYWITMSLPTFWTKPPPDARMNQIYIYRPDYYQDQDGIRRRITLWFNPNERTNLKDVLGRAMSTPVATTPAPGTNSPGTPAVPAVEAEPSSDPFRSPLDSSFHASTSPAPAGAQASPTNASSKEFVPSGRKDDTPAH